MNRNGQLWCIVIMQLQKEVISIQKQPSCEKSVRPKNGRVKTDMKVAKKWL